MRTMNYYVVLGITEDADADTIRSAFRALARHYHPMPVPVRLLLNFNELVKLTRRWEIPNGDAFMIGSCGLHVSPQSSSAS